jgi:hypothetical protein
MTMATGTVAATDKEARAVELRDEIQEIAGDLRQLHKKLADAAGALAVLETRRDELAQEIADGKHQKGAALATLHTDIATAKMPVEVLQKRVSEKESALAGVRDSLAGLEREISIEAQRAARIEEVRTLAAKGMRCAQGINTELGKIIVALAEYDELYRSFRQFMGADPELTGIAREVLAGMQNAWLDGSFLREERRLRREGYTDGDLEFTVKSLRAPR